MKNSGLHVLTEEETNAYIHDSILSEKPFAIIRGGYEFTPLYYFQSQFYIPRFYRKILRNNAGMYPATHIQFRRFAKEYVSSLKQATAVARWEFLRYEDHFLHKYCKTATILSPKGLEPYYFEKPWSRALKNKRVLVIHPFVESIEKQFKIKNRLFQDPLVLPDFELKTYKSVQSITNLTPHRNWSESLEVMKKDIGGLDFDIAILGCGVYAPPLATFIKSMGKSAIQIGGATQILFGIKGKRWLKHPEISKFFTEDWVNPNENETPPLSGSIENGCYW